MRFPDATLPAPPRLLEHTCRFFPKAPARPQTAADHDRRLFASSLGCGIPSPPLHAGANHSSSGIVSSGPHEPNVWTAEGEPPASGERRVTTAGRLRPVTPQLLPPLDRPASGGTSVPTGVAGCSKVPPTTTGTLRSCSSLARSASRLGTPPALQPPRPALQASHSVASVDGGSSCCNGGSCNCCSYIVSAAADNSPERWPQQHTGIGVEVSQAVGQAFDQHACFDDEQDDPPPQQQQQEEKDLATVAVWREELAAALDALESQATEKRRGTGAGLEVRLAHVQALVDSAEDQGVLDRRVPVWRLVRFLWRGGNALHVLVDLREIGVCIMWALFHKRHACSAVGWGVLQLWVAVPSSQARGQVLPSPLPPPCGH